MYTAVKLTQAGTSLTMQVDRAQMATVGRFPEMVFEGTNVDTGQLISLTLPKSSADRQLGRLSLDMASASGALLVFSRDPNPADASKPYWGLNWGEPTTPLAKHLTQPPRASQAARTPPRDDTPHPADMQGDTTGWNGEPEPTHHAGPLGQTKLKTSFKLYDECFAHAMNLTAVAHKEGFPVDTAAIAATLFIQANR